MEQQFFLGPSSIQKLFPFLYKNASKNIFLVRGKKSYEACGAKVIIDNTLNALHCKVIEFYDFEENPKAEDLMRGLELLRQSQASIIVAVGGGSVLDMSKLLRFFYSYSSGVIGSEYEKRCELLPLIVLPTTAGTGSEATHFAVLYKDKVKYSVEHNDILPNVAIVYPPFTYNNPSYLTACTGFDALAQGIEAYWNVNATEESDEYAEKAIKLLWTNLPLAVKSPTEEIRDKVSEGSYWAGRAINIAKTTAPHAFSYPFTTYYGYPHGHAVALTFPFFFKMNKEFDRLKKELNIELYEKKIKHLCSICNAPIKDYIEHSLSLSLERPKAFDANLIMKHVNLQRLDNNPVDLKLDFDLYRVVK